MEVGSWKLGIDLFLLPGSPSGRRSAEEQARSVRQHEVPADSLQSPILRTIALDRELSSDRHRVLRDTHAYQLIRTAALDQPLGYLAVRLLHRDMEPGMWIHHLPLDERPLQGEWLVHIEFGGERMVRPHLTDRQHHGGAGNHNNKLCSHVSSTPSLPARPSASPRHAHRRECWEFRSWSRGTRTRRSVLRSSPAALP